MKRFSERKEVLRKIDKHVKVRSDFSIIVYEAVDEIIGDVTTNDTLIRMSEGMFPIYKISFKNNEIVLNGGFDNENRIKASQNIKALGEGILEFIAQSIEYRFLTEEQEYEQIAQKLFIEGLKKMVKDITGVEIKIVHLEDL